MRVLLPPILVLCALGACVSYETYTGGTQPEESIAVLSEKRFGQRGLALDGPYVVGIDGKKLHWWYDYVRTLPGMHTVDIEVTWSNGFREVLTMEFPAEGGHRYVAFAHEELAQPSALRDLLVPLGHGIHLLALGDVDGRPEESRCFVWIWDETDKRVVASARPVRSPI